MGTPSPNCAAVDNGVYSMLPSLTMIPSIPTTSRESRVPALVSTVTASPTSAPTVLASAGPSTVTMAAAASSSSVNQRPAFSSSWSATAGGVWPCSG